MTLNYPYWNNDEVISSDKLNSMVASIIAGDPLAVKVSNATKNDVNQIVDYLSSLHNKAKDGLNSATYTGDFDTAYTNMTDLVSNKLGAYANDDTVDLYSTGIRASIIAFLQAYDTMMSNDRLNNKNTDNTLGSRIDSEKRARENADNAINTKIHDIQTNGGGRNLAKRTNNFLEATTEAGASIGGLTPEEWKQYEGKTLTFSVTIEWKNWQTNGNNRVGWELAFHVGGKTIWDVDKSPHLWVSGQADGSSGKKRLSTTITVPENLDTDAINGQVAYVQTHGDYFKISNLMVEEGTVAHDWSPAPEDIDSAIENVNAKADANTASISKITSRGGGRNLLHGTSGDWITKTGTGWLNLTTATSNKTSVADYNTGDEFTYSLTVTNDSDSDVLLEMYRCDKDGNRIINPNGSSAINSDHVAPNAHHKRISCTISIDENTWFVEHTLIAAGGTSTSKTVKIKGEMFEVGTVAHDWSPNPDEVKSQIDNLNANKLSSADAKWNLVAKNSSNTYNYASGSKITLPNNSSITINGDRIIPHIYLPTYLTDYLPSTDLNNLATFGEYDNLFVSSATMATLSNRPTNPDTGSALTGDCFFTNHYAYSGTTVHAFQKLYSCDYNYVFIRSYKGGSSGSWTNWSCLTPYA